MQSEIYHYLIVNVISFDKFFDVTRCLIVVLSQSHYVIDSSIRSRICQFRIFLLSEVSNLIQFCSCSIFSLFNFSFFQLLFFVLFWNHLLILNNSSCNSVLLLHFWLTSCSLDTTTTFSCISSTFWLSFSIKLLNLRDWYTNFCRLIILSAHCLITLIDVRLRFSLSEISNLLEFELTTLFIHLNELTTLFHFKTFWINFESIQSVFDNRKSIKTFWLNLNS